MEQKTKVHRSYKLKCYPTFSKSEIARYTIKKFNEHLNENIKLLEYNFGRFSSTSGKGNLFNKAQKCAKDTLAKAKKSSKVLKTKYSTPEVKALFSRVEIEKSKNSSFDYFVKAENMFDNKKVVRLPTKSHTVLNKALKDGWTMSKHADLHYNEKKNEFFVIVFVSKEVKKSEPTKRFIGVDVGLNHAYVSSDGFKSRGLKSIRRKMNKKIADRQKFKIQSVKTKTHLKQKLDRHAKEIVNRVHSPEIGLAFERRVTIGRLSRNRLQGWAGAYLASRVDTLAKELGIYVVEVNPQYTSQTCPKCNHKSKRNRDGVKFLCEHCGYKNHADFVGSVNIARKASGERKLDKAT